MTTEKRDTFWRSGLAWLAGLAIFVLLMRLLPQPKLSGDRLSALGAILALVPALLWLGFFYQQARKTRGPIRTIWRVLIFSALLASGAGLPILDDFFKLDDWLVGDLWLRIAGLILITGFTQEFLKYLALRYTAFPTDSYQDRMDGIIHGLAAGVGFATVLNMEFVISNQGVVLFVGSLHMVNTVLAHAGLASITGYFLAAAKYGEKPVWWVPAGLALAAVLNGLFVVARREITTRGLVFDPMWALVLSLVFTVGALGMLYLMTLRAERHASKQRV